MTPTPSVGHPQFGRTFSEIQKEMQMQGKKVAEFAMTQQLGRSSKSTKYFFSKRNRHSPPLKLEGRDFGAPD